MNILITGGNGFIGQSVRNLCKSLCIDYISIDGQERNPSSNNIKCSIFDDPGYFVKMSDVVIHLIGEGVVSRCQQFPLHSFESNIMSLQVILEECRKNNKKIVFPSSAAVYGITEELPVKETAPLHPNNIYAYHKSICEKMIMAYGDQYGVDFVILRLFNVLGRGVKGLFTRFIEASESGESFHAFGVSQYRDFVYLEDVAKSLFNAAIDDKANGKIINIGSGYGFQIRDILKLMQEIYPNVNVIEGKSQTPLYDHICDTSKSRLLLDFVPTITTLSNLRQILKTEVCV